MRKSLLAGLVLAIGIVATGCAGDLPLPAQMQKNLKHTESAWTGLHRVITWKTDDGKTVLATYKGDFQIEVIQNGVSFIDADGMEHKLIGGIIEVTEVSN